MNRIILANATVIFENEVKIATVICEDGIISQICDGDSWDHHKNGVDVIDCTGYYLLPGLIDLHVHGGGGQDSADVSEESYKQIARTQVMHGTTSFVMAIPGGLPDTYIHDCLSVIRSLSDSTDGANILGAHLEGPFINPAKRAAIPKDNLSLPSIEKAESVLGDYRNHVKIMTLSSELENSDELIRFLKGNGIIVGLGHSDASYDNTAIAVKNGATHFTHLYNAMSLLTSRDPGMLGVALLNDSCYTEIIADGYHVHPDNIRILFALKPHDKICLITDAISVVGTNATSFSLPGLDNIQVHDGRTWGPNGAIIGSILTQNTAIKNIYSWFELPLNEVVMMASKNPAVELGIYPQKGTIKKGSDADLTILTTQFDTKITLVGGNIVFKR